MMSHPLSGLQVVGVRYSGSHRVPRDERSVTAYAESGAYELPGVPVRVNEPRMPEDLRTGDEPTDLGILNGRIADVVACGRRRGDGILLIGGNCSHLTGVIGGLQDAHGAALRLGLVFFDAHGDFNTPRTTLTGSLGGMPVAVAAGLAHPTWREGSHIAAPIPTDRIILVDVRHLDDPEERLIRATDAVIASPAKGFPGEDLSQAASDLASRVDMIYLHIDSDILDLSLVPNHGTGEPNGPDMEQVLAAVETVMATGKVVAYAVVSVYGEGEGAEVTQASGMELVGGGLRYWAEHGLPDC
jgi:arginase